MTSPSASVIVLAWNGRDYLEASLTALLSQEYAPLEVIVVDNASTDGSADLVTARFPQVRLIRNERNLGFSAGNNRGLKAAGGDLLVLLNQDAVVKPGWLQALAAVMAGDERIGIAGCKVYYPNGRLQHAGGYVTHPQAMPGHYGLNEEDRGQYDTPRDVQFVTGASLAIRRNVLERIGPLDEGYFLYYEDVDWCLRASEAGYRVVYTPDAVVTHVEAATSERGSSLYLERIHASRLRFLLKFYDPDTLLDETFPAERAWLRLCDARERVSLARAYRGAQRGLAAIWEARRRDRPASVPPITDAQGARIEEDLEQLRDFAWRWPDIAASAREGDSLPDEQRGLEALEARREVVERPFNSNVPLLGPLIARFRDGWNSISTKWYVRPLLQQQNEFNLAVVQHLQRVAARLDTHGAWLADQDDDQQALLARTEELSRQIDRMNRALASLEERLSLLEERLGDDAAGARPSATPATQEPGVAEDREEP